MPTGQTPWASSVCRSSTLKIHLLHYINEAQKSVEVNADNLFFPVVFILSLKCAYICVYLYLLNVYLSKNE